MNLLSIALKTKGFFIDFEFVFDFEIDLPHIESSFVIQFPNKNQLILIHFLSFFLSLQETNVATTFPLFYSKQARIELFHFYQLKELRYF